MPDWLARRLSDERITVRVYGTPEDLPDKPATVLIRNVTRRNAERYLKILLDLGWNIELIEEVTYE